MKVFNDILQFNLYERLTLIDQYPDSDRMEFIDKLQALVDFTRTDEGYPVMLATLDRLDSIKRAVVFVFIPQTQTVPESAWEYFRDLAATNDLYLVVLANQSCGGIAVKTNGLAYYV